MRIEFENDDLRRLAEDASYRPSRWSAEVVSAYRKKIQVLRSAIDERDLYAMRSLHLEKLAGKRSGTSSIRLNKQFRLILRFRTDPDGHVVIVIDVVDYH